MPGVRVLDHLGCPGCSLSGNDSGRPGQLPEEGPLLPAGPTSTSPSPPTIPPEALAFICALGAACILANALLTTALLRTRPQAGPEKALVLRRRLRGLLLNLALADLLSAALLGPLEALALSRDGAWDLGPFPCRLFLGADVLLGSASAYALAALALHAAHFWAPGPFVGLAWLLSASLSVPAFALANVVALPFPSGLEPRPYCSLPLAMLAPGAGGSPPLGLLLLRLSGAVLGFVLPTLVILVCNVEAVVAYVRNGRREEAEEAADIREVEDESLKLCFALSLTHVICSFPRFAYSLIFLVEPDSSSLRIPPLTSPEGMPSAFLMAVLHYAAPALRPAVVVATSTPLRRAILCSPASSTSTAQAQR